VRYWERYKLKIAKIKLKFTLMHVTVLPAKGGAIPPKLPGSPAQLPSIDDFRVHFVNAAFRPDLTFNDE
jgi:hypothetical protein